MCLKAVQLVFHGTVQLELVEDLKQAGLMAFPFSWNCPTLFHFKVLAGRSTGRCSKPVSTHSKPAVEFVVLIQAVRNEVFLVDTSPYAHYEQLLELEVSCLGGDTSSQTLAWKRLFRHQV